jgi:hypothetical protein
LDEARRGQEKGDRRAGRGEHAIRGRSR